MTADWTSLFSQRKLMTMTTPSTTSWMTWMNLTWRTTGRTGLSRSPVGVAGWFLVKAWSFSRTPNSVFFFLSSTQCLQSFFFFREGGEWAARGALWYSELSWFLPARVSTDFYSWFRSLLMKSIRAEFKLNLLHISLFNWEYFYIQQCFSALIQTLSSHNTKLSLFHVHPQTQISLWNLHL